MKGLFCTVWLWGLVACGQRNEVECSGGGLACQSGGSCVQAPTGHSWCAYPDSMCPSGLRYGTDYTGDDLSGMCVTGGTDAGIGDDAPLPDAGIRAFDVAYGSEWKFSVIGEQTDGYFVVIATGGMPVSAGSIHLKSVDDDHPTAFLTVTAHPRTESVDAGTAGGFLTPLSTHVLVDSGIVTEPRVNTTQASSYLTLEVDDAPTGTYDFHATVTIVVDNIEVPLPMTIHMLPPPDIYAEPVVGRRIVVYR